MLLMNLLYDFYGSLLTDKQREIFEMYYFNDYSLGEISEILDISRQGVYDTLKRAESSLEFFEDKLNLLKKHNEIKLKIDNIRNILLEIKPYIIDPDAEKKFIKVLGKLSDLNP